MKTEEETGPQAHEVADAPVQVQAHEAEPQAHEQTEAPAPEKKPAPKDDCLEYDLIRDIVPVVFKTGRLAGDYALVEVTGDERDTWLTSMAGKMRTDKQGRPAGMRDYKGSQAVLIAQAFYKAELLRDVDGAVKGVIKTIARVSEEDIRTLPARVQKGLFKKIHEISGMEEDDPEDDNEPGTAANNAAKNG